MVYKILLVNHTRFEYVELCRSNFSQERRMFCVPENWNGSNDDMEVMTEFIFREKLKNRKKYLEVEMFLEPDDDDEPNNSDEEDFKEDMRKKYLINEKTDNQEENADKDEDPTFP